MWQSLVPIVVLLLTGLAFVAYRHPKGYQRLFIALNALMGAIMVGLSSYDAGTRAAYHALRTFIEKDNLKAAETAADAVESWSGWIGVFLVFSIILNVFYWLPDILGHDPSKPPKD